ncbi:NB-ARC domain-containing protein [Rhizobium calliandrae]|uniref:NB-ARC domain-containing protein n=1 Tax=Rhizobium calliandrae TaxID=1312182 RepID=A0ABT7KGL6_9HYPH|nr:NB-ARC domain-containing protein [Rhizobium calliandrae]MDL2407758.1 NB-ARC domain-containing protein [Rhizobium calliandrae]
MDRIIGRDEALSDIQRAVQERRFVSIVGSGGVGKTTLAALLAREIEHFDAVHFIDLSGVCDPASVFTAMASAIDSDGNADEIGLDQLLQRISAKRCLLIFDNCEHLIDASADLVAQVLNRTSNIHVLVTSREMLRIPGEAVFLLRPLGVPPNTGRLTATRARLWPSVEMFLDRASHAGLSSEISDEQAAIIGAICRRLDGNPLAIELAASRVNAYGLERLADLVNNHLALRWRGNRNAAPRHQTVESMLDWSYALLSDASRRVLDRLSVFVGDFSIEAASAIASDEEMSSFEVAEAISDLVDKSLLVFQSDKGPPRLKLLGITRTYAALKLAVSGDEPTVRRTHAHYYVEQLRRHSIESPVGGKSEGETDLNLCNAVSALEWAFSKTGDIELGVTLCVEAVPSFIELSRFVECRRWCKCALSSIPPHLSGSSAEIKLLEGMAIAGHLTLEPVEDIEKATRRGIEVSAALGDSRHELHFLAGLHIAMIKSGEFRRAMEVAERFASVAVTTGGPSERMIAEWLLGTAYHFIGNQTAALKCYSAGFGLLSRWGSVDLGYFVLLHRALARVCQSRALWLCGSPELSMHLVDDAIDETRGQVGPFCVTLLVAIEIFFLCGKYTRAGELVRELNYLTSTYSLTGFQEAGISLRQQLEHTCGNGLPPTDQLQARLNGARSAKFVSMKLGSLSTLALALAKSSEFEEAMSAIDAALALDERAGGTFRLAELLRIKAEIVLDLPKPQTDLAEHLLARALEIARDQGSTGWELRITLTLARLRLTDGRERGKQVLVLLREYVSRFGWSSATEDLRSANLLLRQTTELPRRANSYPQVARICNA